MHIPSLCWIKNRKQISESIFDSSVSSFATLAFDLLSCHCRSHQLAVLDVRQQLHPGQAGGTRAQIRQAWPRTQTARLESTRFAPHVCFHSTHSSLLPHSLVTVPLMGGTTSGAVRYCTPYILLIRVPLQPSNAQTSAYIDW